MQADRAFAPVEDGNGERHDEQKRSAVRNDPVVTHLTPRFAGIGQARPGVFDKWLDKHTRFRCLAHRQAAVACNPLADITPHRRVVAGLDFGTFAIGLLSVARCLRSIGLDVHDVGALHCGCRLVLRLGWNLRKHAK